MSMPNRFCLIERRLDIIEKILRINIPEDLITLPADINKSEYQKRVEEFVFHAVSETEEKDG